MQKILGYVLMGVGLVVVSFNLLFKNILGDVAFLSFLVNADLILIGIIGLACIISGYFLSQQGQGSKKQQREVPIYEGEGKKRRIVGYRKMK